MKRDPSARCLTLPGVPCAASLFAARANTSSSVENVKVYAMLDDSLRPRTRLVQVWQR